MNAYQSLNFAEKIARIDPYWSPRVIAEMNDYQFKVVKLLGDFIWHDHLDTDETFIVLEGQLRIDFRDGHVLVNAGEMYVVSKGCLLYTSPSPRDRQKSRMPSSA